MPTFIEKCCCRGNRPAGVVGLHHNLRPEITGALLRDRRVARFLVAPKGYGKSACAYEYAQVVFGFKGVFWVRCDSPCFIRDLDDGTLLDQVRHADAGARLVVFDDLPQLDPDRADAFDGVLRGLLDDGCEALAVCAPSLDTVSARHMDKILIDGAGLLLSDDEVQVERLRGNLPKDASAVLPPSRRAACLVWDEKGPERILKGVSEEELPSELELLIFCILALGEGELSELAEFVGEARAVEDASYLASMYPYLGIDMDARTFGCIDVPLSDVAALSRMSLGALAKSSLQKDREALCFAVADMLLRKRKAARAADLLLHFAGKASSAKWAVRQGWRLVAECDALPLARLTEKARPCEGASLGGLLARRAWACALLGDFAEAQKARRRVLKSSAAAWQDAVAAAVCPAWEGGVHGEALAEQLEIASSLRGACADDGRDDSRSLREGLFDWGCMLDLERARAQGADSFVRAFCELAEKDADGHAPDALRGRRSALLASGAWFVEERAAAARKPQAAPEGPNAAGEISSVVEGIAGLLREAKGAEGLQWPECVAVNALQTAEEAWPFAFESGASPKAVAASRAVSMALLVQAEEHRRGSAERESEKGNYELTHENSFRADPQPASKVAALRVSTPSLVLSLFGGFEAWIGTDRAEARQVRRRNAKIALALLAMNHGREVTKERLAYAIWPDADLPSSRQNLYVVWAYLKRTLKVGDSCPYLVSTQTGYKLDSRYVTTDVEAFDELCKGLLFGNNDKEVWEGLYEKVSCDFGEDLLPEIAGNAQVDAMRDRYRTQLVDGLVEASFRMGQEGECRGAIWFAREALRRDGSREDAYIAMMEAQLASNQRAAALDTYFECRRFLSEQLGIDPSRRVVELYRSVIETEEDF